LTRGVGRRKKDQPHARRHARTRLAARSRRAGTRPLFHLLWHPRFSVPLIGQMGFAMIIAMFEGVAPAAAAEAFPGSVRCVGLANQP